MASRVLLRTLLGCRLQPHRLRRLSTSSSSSSSSSSEKYCVYFDFPDGKKVAASAKPGQNLLDVVLDNEVDIDGFGACEGTLACSTCHLIFSDEDYKRLGSEPCDEELDMLDLAYGLTETSRLGCQVCITKKLDGIHVQVPADPSAIVKAVMPAVMPSGAGGAPSCFDRIKMGALMGAGVGLSAGALVGGIAALRMGFRGSELISQVGKAMMQSGGTFGTLMAIGAGIRC